MRIILKRARVAAYDREAGRTGARVSKDIKRLFLAHRRELQAYLTRKLGGDRDIAADLTQETFLRFAQQRSGHPAKAIAHERSYLYRTAHNLAVDHMVRESQDKTDAIPQGELVAIPDDTPSPEQATLQRNRLALVRAALLELPERTRQVFALARLEGLTYREVATRLEISDSSVQKHLAKATEHVMQRLRDG